MRPTIFTLILAVVSLAGCVTPAPGVIERPDTPPVAAIDSSPPADTVVVNPRPGALPIVSFFNAIPHRIGTGDRTMLNWYVTGATSVSINEGIGQVTPEGNVSVSPPINTEYVLTATNALGSVTAAVQVLVIPGTTGLPVINSFAADPGTIAPGGSTLLTWDVSNADLVKIDPNIGVFEPKGSITVSPTQTITYTLSAAKGVTLVVSMTQVLVARSPSGKPDLVISNISKVETADGVKIAYTIRNQGNGDAPSSITRLYANGVYRAMDPLEVVAAGSAVTRQIAGWLYDPTTNIVKVVVDADNNVTENDKTNNALQVAFPVTVTYDFIDRAATAQWGDGYPYSRLKFGDDSTQESGLARYLTERKMEDGSVPDRVLETRPRPTVAGWIMGDFTAGYQAVPGDYFYGVVGLLDGMTASDVTFWLYARLHGDEAWDIIAPGVYATYANKLKTIAVPLPPSYFRKNVEFSLRVSTFGEPLQDWGIWVKAALIR